MHQRRRKVIFLTKKCIKFDFLDFDVLKICDGIRDTKLPEIGIELKDGKHGPIIGFKGNL